MTMPKSLSGDLRERVVEAVEAGASRREAAERFEISAHIEQCSARTLKRGEIVVIDNLPVHKVPGVREAIEAAGATAQFLLQYSPDLNPIEMPFSKFKAFLRKVSERTVRGVRRRIGSFLPTVSRAECRNYFRHAGYASI
jgi:transposase